MIRLIAAASAILTLLCCAPADRNGVRAACRAVRFEGTKFTACHTDPETHDILLADRGLDGRPMRDFVGLKPVLGDSLYPRIAFAMNAGMFDAQGRPVGYYVEGGSESVRLNRRAGPGNFHLQPNGVFWGDARGWHVATTEAFAAAKPDHVRFATQSGPMLLIDGVLHPGIADNGTSLQIRNAVGVSLDGGAWFAISDEPVSFGRFARLFRDKLACPDALYLDGAVSRLWDPISGRLDGGAPIGPIVVAVQKR